MNPATQQILDTPAPSLALHAQARLHRARMMGQLFSRLLARLSVPRLGRLPVMRWG